jgi:type VI secretion system (T6SS) effector TldE1-like protein
MTWLYTQDKGELRDPKGLIHGIGYSGNTWGLNNPAAQFQIGVGPIPVGDYVIGPPHTPVDHLGPLALPLWPDKANAMHGRSGFFMHGDNRAGNHTASHGCVIMPPNIRTAVNASKDKHLRVVSTYVGLASFGLASFGISPSS